MTAVATAALLLLSCSAAASLLLALPVAVAAESLAHHSARVARRFWIIVNLLPLGTGALLTILSFLSLLGDITATPHQARVRPHFCLERFTSLPDAPFRSQLYAATALALVLYALVRFGLSLAASRRTEGIARRALGAVGREPLVLPSAEADCFALGLQRPVIVVTQGLCELLSAEELAAVLAHERCHQRQRDNLLELLIRLATDALVWVPSTHYYHRALRTVTEQACDAAAAAATSPEALAAALQKMEAAQRVRQVKQRGDLAALRPLFPSHANPAARAALVLGEGYVSVAPRLPVVLTIELLVLATALLWLRRPLHDTLYCAASSLLAVLRRSF